MDKQWVRSSLRLKSPLWKLKGMMRHALICATEQFLLTQHDGVMHRTPPLCFSPSECPTGKSLGIQIVLARYSKRSKGFKSHCVDLEAPCTFFDSICAASSSPWSIRLAFSLTKKAIMLGAPDFGQVFGKTCQRLHSRDRGSG